MPCVPGMTRQDEASDFHDGHLEIPRDERRETLVRAADFVISAGSVAVLLLYFDESLVSDLQTITTSECRLSTVPILSHLTLSNHYGGFGW